LESDRSVALNSFVGETILAGKGGDVAMLDDYRLDFSPFDFVLVHPTRTFVEKLLALHGSFSKAITDVRTRHYYDVFALYTRRQDMPEFLDSEDFRSLLREAVEIGNVNFGTDIDPELDIASSPALNVTAKQIEVLETQYREERRYYFKGQPAFAEIVAAISEIRDRLKRH
jgi:hypothetical protein